MDTTANPPRSEGNTSSHRGRGAWSRRLSRPWLVVLLASVAMALVAVVCRDSVLEYYYISLLRSADRQQRDAAAQKLGELRSVKAVSPLVELLAPEWTEFNREHPLFQAVLGAGRRAVPRLRAGFESADELERKVCADLLSELGPEACAALPDLVDALDDPAYEVRLASVIAIGSLGACARTAAPRVLDLMRRTGEYILFENATAALKAIGAEDRDVVPVLVERLDGDQNDSVDWKAAMALQEFTGLPEIAIPGLTLALDDPDGAMRLEVIEALGAHGTKGVPALKGALSSRREHDRLYAAMELARIGDLDESVVSVLLQLARDSDADVRSAAVGALGSARSVSDEVVACLISSLKDPVGDVREYACRALARLSTRALRAIPHVIEVLRDPVSDAREAAAEALGKMGPAARRAIPILQELAERDATPYVQDAARGALELIGATAAPWSLEGR